MAKVYRIEERMVVPFLCSIKDRNKKGIPMKLYKFTVKGNGAFPVDMLRYDGCFPRTTEDAIKLCADSHDRLERREVTLIMPVDSKDRMPTTGRWNSFCWTVSNIEFIKN